MLPIKKAFAALLLLSTSLTGCNNAPTQEAQKDALEAHVMEVHDEAMAKMGRVYRLRRDLGALRDTLKAQQADSATLQLLHQQLELLSLADSSMMDWMHHYQAPDSLPLPQAMHYLEAEQLKINKVKTLMDSATTAAQQTYSVYEKK